MDPEKTNEHKQRFLDLFNAHIKRPGSDKLLDWLLKSDFFIAPASTQYHGAYEGGLLQHSLNVFDCLDAWCQRYDLYSDDTLTKENVAIAALLHDVCKSHYYQKGTRNVKDPDTGKWYAKEVYGVSERLPLGHGEKSCLILQWFIPLTVDELLAIRWHMGGFDSAVKGGDRSLNKAWEEAGTTKLPVLLHLADMEATYLLESGKE